MKYKLPSQRWQIAPENARIAPIVKTTGLLPLIAQVVVNRGIKTPELAKVYVEPKSQQLPSPLEEFQDLEKSVELISCAIESGEKIAICGDYDADGMTSTALLWRALKHLGANVDYAIPSRMKDGYGINIRIVEEFALAGVGLILTVDNGISAVEPIARAIELGILVIITDHHDLPEQLPDADAILNPKLLPETSPYRGLAGVGIAYILAITTAQSLGLHKGLTGQLLELFTLGTIADLAPLVGVNRRWLKRGLRLLADSQIAGVRALIEEAAIDEERKNLKPDDIGFKLGPRINAVGRIDDPQIVIELLTTEDMELARERAKQCEQINRKRQQLCETIFAEAIAKIEDENHPINWKRDRVLVICQANWHHGVIGIVASRLVDRYGVPVFIATCEEDPQKLRGSARGIPEFHVFEALQYSGDLLGKFGGHQAAGGFSLLAENLDAFKKKLSEFACQCLEPHHLSPLVKIDSIANFNQLNLNLYNQIDSLQPWGIGNDFPVFWTPNVRVLEQQTVGKTKNHLRLTVSQEGNSGGTMKAIAWQWGDYYPLPSRLDIAYKLQENHWNGKTTIELEIVGARHPCVSSPTKKAQFNFKGRSYACSFSDTSNELRIRNDRGQVLAVSRGQKIALLGTTRDNAKKVDVTQPRYFDIVKAARAALDGKK